MPRIRYGHYNPKPVTQELIADVDEILTAMADRGFLLTVRQAWYRMVADKKLPDDWIDEEYNLRNGLDRDTKNTQRNYKRFSNLVAAARDGGALDWDHLTDRGRVRQSWSHWANQASFLRSVVNQYAIDLWLRQPKRVEVWIEKDALSQVVEQACEPWTVPYMACKGYPSASCVWEAAHNRFKRWHDTGDCEEIVVIQLSDHDASGVDMTRDLQTRFDMYSTPYADDDTHAEIMVERIALTIDQVQEHSLEPDPAKATDPRSRRYREQFGDDSWELDALDPQIIVDLIDDAIRRHCNTDLFEEDQEREREMREQLQRIPARWDRIRELLDEEDA